MGQTSIIFKPFSAAKLRKLNKDFRGKKERIANLAGVSVETVYNVFRGESMNTSVLKVLRDKRDEILADDEALSLIAEISAAMDNVETAEEATNF